VLCPDVSLFCGFSQGSTSNARGLLVPIPGTKHLLEENVAATEIALTPDDLRRIEAVAPQGVAAGDRYPTQHMNAVNR